MIPIGSPVATVVTVHDMSLRLYPKLPSGAAAAAQPAADARRDPPGLVDRHGVEQRPARSAAPARRARRIACRSFTKPRARCSGRSPIARGSTTMRARYGLPRPFILYVGTIEPRKNLTRLMTAFADARKAGIPHHLVCVGPYGWSSRDLAGHIERLGIKTPCTSPATCRSSICRRSTTSATSSRSRRSTKASACRSSRRWRAAFRC